MLIMLIEPPVEDEITDNFYRHPLPPLWALSLATYLRQRKPEIKIKILDGQLLPLNILLKEIESIKPDIVGLSPKAASYSNVLVLARKSKLMGAKVVFGGHHATGFKKEILRNRGLYSKDYCVDAIIQQDGERAFYEYIIGSPLSKIKNLVYQTKRGIRENQVEYLNVNDLPIPDRSLIDLGRYFQYYQKSKKFSKPLNIYSSKGCLWRKHSSKTCIFCPQMETNLRLRDPFLVRKEINLLITKYGINFIRECSDDFLSDRKWFERFFKVSVLSAGNNLIPMGISARVSEIDAAIVRKLKKLNVEFVSLGIESMSAKSLKTMHKGTSIFLNKRAISLLLQEKISMKLFFVLAAPGETTATLQDTLGFIKELFKMKITSAVIAIRVNTLIPLPNSFSWELLLKKTKSKYYDQDLINFREVSSDWIKHFCHITPKDILIFYEKLKQIKEINGNSKVQLQLSDRKIF